MSSIRKVGLYVKSSCRQCGGKFEYLEAETGQRQPCPHCGKEIDLVYTASQSPPKPPQKREGGEAAMTAAAIGGSCGLSLLGIFLWLFLMGAICVAAVSIFYWVVSWFLD